MPHSRKESLGYISRPKPPLGREGRKKKRRKNHQKTVKASPDQHKIPKQHPTASPVPPPTAPAKSPSSSPSSRYQTSSPSTKTPPISADDRTHSPHTVDNAATAHDSPPGNATGYDRTMPVDGVSPRYRTRLILDRIYTSG